ncbi:MAG: CoA-binding protein [Actinobacteria bacterium]|nr:CoA-binding protein [Actinomycetota bacterium]
MTMGTGQLSSLLLQGYEGRIYPIHPEEDTVLGLRAYRKVSELEELPDLAVIVLPTRIVNQILEECGGLGIKAAVVISGGFREVGEAGAKLEKELLEIAVKYGITLVGPNCIGVSNFHIGLNTTYFPYEQEAGSVAVISQSGTYSCHIYTYAEKSGIKLGQTVSIGNATVLGISDYLKYFADDPSIKSIAVYIEGISNGREFVEAAEYATAKKPVVALYVGGTGYGARAGGSHTGALAGQDELYEGVFHQSGIIRANTVEELFDWSWALATQPLPSSDRVCVLTNSGGAGASMADACGRAGLSLPRLSEETQEKIRELLPGTASTINPVDMTFHLNFADLLKTVPEILFESGEIDGIVMYGIFGTHIFEVFRDGLGDLFKFPVEDARPIIRGLVEGFTRFPDDTGIPVIVSTFMGPEDEEIAFLRSNDIPVSPSPERAVNAMAALCRYAEYRRSL